MKSKIFAHYLVSFMLAISTSSLIAQTQQEMIQNAQQSAKEVIGKIQLEAPASSFNTDEEYKKFGIEDMGSTGSLMSSSTKLSATFSASKVFTCRTGSSLYLSYLKIDFSECNIDSAIYLINYCSSLDGRACPPSLVRSASLTSDVEFTFDSVNKIKLSECSGSKCKIEVKHTPTDDFSGDLEAEAELRDSTNQSAATSAALANINNPLYDDYKSEAGDTAEYVNRAMEDVETLGEMPIYRNSDSDKAQFGNRAGSILVDAESMENGEVCTQDPSSINTQECNNIFQAAEFVCDQSPAICSYERKENIVRDCGRKLSMSCSKTANCSEIDYLDYTGSLPSLSAQESLILINKSYVIQNNTRTLLMAGTTSDYDVTFEDKGDGRFRLSNNRFGYDSNPNRRTFEFELQIKDINKITSFMYEKTRHEDFFTILVNGTPVYTFPTVSGISSSCYPWRDFKKGASGFLGSSKLRATCSNGSFQNSSVGQWDDRSESIQSPNINIKSHLRTGTNKIYMILGVNGGGHIDSTFKANFNKECSCEWTERWENLPCNM